LDDRRAGQYRRRRMSKVFVITGPSGVGKGTLIKRLLSRCPNLELSISATTREPREGEVDGVDYHFLSAEEFERRVEEKDFLEFATYSGNRYGTLRSEVERRLEAGHSVVLEIEVQGATQVRAAKPDSIQIFIAPPDPTVLRDRLAGRGTDSADAIDKRLETAEIELASQGDFDYRVVNDDLEQATEELVGIVRAELGLGPGG
jgi:guanylate kinase